MERATCIAVLFAVGFYFAVIRSRRAANDLALRRSDLLRERFDIRDLIADAVRSCRSWINERGLRLRVERPAAARVLIDRERIREVFDVLLHAAIANGRPSSEIAIQVSNSDGLVRIAMIEPAPVVEESKADPIAILLCRRIVEAHGGRLGVQESPISRTYWFTLPCAA